MFAARNSRRSQQRGHHAIGLDVGSDAVKMLQLCTSAVGATEVVAAARVPLVPGAGVHDVAAAIRSAMSEGPFAGRKVSAALPHRHVHVRTIRVSAPNAQAFDPLAAAEREAALSFSFPLTSAQVGFLPAGEVRQAGEARHEVIAIAAADRDVTQFLELLRMGGVIAESLDFEPAALYRALGRAVNAHDEAAQQVHVLLDIGASATRIMIGRGPDLCVLKTVNTGTRHLESVMAARLGVSEADVRGLRSRSTEPTAGAPRRRDSVGQALHDALRTASADLLEQVVFCLRYFSVSFRGRPALKVWVTGGGADAADLRAQAQATLGLPVETLPLFTALQIGPLGQIQSTSAMGEWSVALGLALRGASASAAAQPVEAAHA